MNNQEREAFEAWYLGKFYMGDNQCGLEWLSTEPCGGYRHQHPKEQHIAFQAGAAYQREQVKGLVEALEDAVDDYDAWKKDAEVTPNESLLNWTTKAKEALAVHRAAPEGK